jgi:hypothetical protein
MARLPALPPLQRVVKTDPAIGALISRLRAGNPRYLDQPAPGFWLMRLVKGGPLVPACIQWIHTTHEPGEPENAMERSPFLAAFLAGKPVDLDRVSTWAKEGTLDEPEYRFRLKEMVEWAMPGRDTYARKVAVARPYEKIDPMQCELPW